MQLSLLQTNKQNSIYVNYIVDAANVLNKQNAELGTKTNKKQNRVNVTRDTDAGM